MATFKTRARALDMLGRQQIAGIPTAISELFKNAYDAYADLVEVDFFRESGLFVLRDDGLGMTLDEFEDRWLVIGTESKLGKGKGISTARIDTRKEYRPIMGEKGIGRLAIALIGSQMLILTRAKINNNPGDLVAAFINWGLFECPGIDLNDIEIPIRIFKDGTLPNRKDLDEMTNVVKKNVQDLIDKFPKNLVTKIMGDLINFKFDPLEIELFLNQATNDSDKKSLSFSEGGFGTHFYVLPTNEALLSEIEKDFSDSGNSKIKRFLLGFNNTMLPNLNEPKILPSFRYWKDSYSFIDILSEREFFTPDDFNSTDIRVYGKFDKFGTFTGTVDVYGDQQKYSLPWKNQDKPTSCGQFEIGFAYLPGKQIDSKLPPEDYARIKNKCDRIGGLYIYRDGLRILPYGDSDFDWLQVEKRRTLGASYYFFSYRRLFGAISISHKENQELLEKAGREGFQENRAYREFRDILIHFLLQLAGDFFREDSEHNKKREELRKLEKARKEGEKIRKESRKIFAESLNDFFSISESNILVKNRDEVINSLKNDLDKASHQIFPEYLESDLVKAEIKARQHLNRMREELRIEIPSGIGLTDELEHDWRAYESEIEKLESEFFLPLENQISQIMLDFNQRSNIEIDRRNQILKLIKDITNTNKNKIKNEITETQQEFKLLEKRFFHLINEINHDEEKILTEAEIKVDRMLSEKSSEKELEEIRHALEKGISDNTDQSEEILRHIRNQLIHLNWKRDEDGYLIGEPELSAALETELLGLQEQFDSNLELAQLGMAIEVINHEFNQTVRNIRINLNGLKRWADKNPKLLPHYQDLRTSFEHLDAYLTLLSPLSRRLYRQSTEIKGSNIENFLRSLFLDSLSLYNIDLIVTESFRDKVFLGYPSTFYPVFINLIDNAIFWLRDKKDFPREIYLESDNDDLIFSDNGPGISDRIRERIFDYGFSRKPAGRGLGLYISKRVLNKEGLDLELIKSPSGRGATFRIGQKTTNGTL